MENENQVPKQTTSALQVLKIPEYRSFISARFFYIVAQRMITTVVGWKIYELTGNPFAIGLLGLSEFLPAFTLALYAGHAIDRSDKRALLLKTTFLYLFCAAGLILISTSYANNNLSTTRIQWLIYFVIFCTGIIRAFAGPALNAIIAQIVPKNQLASAVTLNSSTWLSASVIGHATGGFLIAHTDYVTIFSIVAVLVGIAFYFLYSLAPKPILLTSNDKKAWESISEGLRFVFK